MRVWRSATILAHFLTTVRRIDNFVVGKEFVGEYRRLDRILRRLKLHAEGRQIGGRTPRARRAHQVAAAASHEQRRYREARERRSGRSGAGRGRRGGLRGDGRRRWGR